MQGEPFPRARLRGRHCASPRCRWLPSNCFSPPSTIRRRHPGRRPPHSEPRGDRWSPPRSEPRGDRWSSPRSVPTACHHRCGGAALRMPQPQHERLVSEPWSERVSLGAVKCRIASETANSSGWSRELPRGDGLEGTGWRRLGGSGAWAAMATGRTRPRQPITDFLLCVFTPCWVHFCPAAFQNWLHLENVSCLYFLHCKTLKGENIYFPLHPKRPAWCRAQST